MSNDDIYSRVVISNSGLGVSNIVYIPGQRKRDTRKECQGETSYRSHIIYEAYLLQTLADKTSMFVFSSNYCSTMKDKVLAWRIAGTCPAIANVRASQKPPGLESPLPSHPRIA
jgi:hypothetical protein